LQAKQIVVTICDSCAGYGNPVPVTQFGRMMCIIFSLFGIPLTLVTIADIGKFLSENLIWMYGNYLKFKEYVCEKHRHKKARREHVCERIPAMLVLTILVLYTALGGVLMSHLEPWSFFTSFYWSFITMTTMLLNNINQREIPVIEMLIFQTI
uniref:Ion_trans_2 domain-containing protein n=1 Tax=Anisakis simplex TaxID=6269 RepID=A0A0M3JDA8_ANISI